MSVVKSNHGKIESDITGLFRTNEFGTFVSHSRKLHKSAESLSFRFFKAGFDQSIDAFCEDNLRKRSISLYRVWHICVARGSFFYFKNS